MESVSIDLALIVPTQDWIALVDVLHEDPSETRPISVTRVDDRFYVVDGNDRLYRAMIAGWEHFSCEVVDTTPVPRANIVQLSYQSQAKLLRHSDGIEALRALLSVCGTNLQVQLTTIRLLGERIVVFANTDHEVDPRDVAAYTQELMTRALRPGAGAYYSMFGDDIISQNHRSGHYLPFAIQDALGLGSHFNILIWSIAATVKSSESILRNIDFFDSKSKKELSKFLQACIAPEKLHSALGTTLRCGARPWVTLLKTLRDRFAHRGMFFVMNDFKEILQVLLSPEVKRERTRHYVELEIQEDQSCRVHRRISENGKRMGAEATIRFINGSIQVTYYSIELKRETTDHLRPSQDDTRVCVQFCPNRSAFHISWDGTDVKVVADTKYECEGTDGQHEIYESEWRTISFSDGGPRILPSNREDMHFRSYCQLLRLKLGDLQTLLTECEKTEFQSTSVL